MKKRLLSAALALAMVLTMLPLSVMPVSAAVATDGSAGVSYQERNNANDDYNGAPGFFAEVKDTNGKVTGYEKVTGGFVVNNKWYTGTFPTNTAGDAPLSTTFTVVGNAGNADLKDATSATVDVYGKDSSVTLVSTNSKLTSITVKDSRYQTEVQKGLRGADDRGSVTLPTGLANYTGDKSVSISLTNVESDSSVSLKGKSTATNPAPLGNSITLTNAKIGGVTLGATDCMDSKGVNHVYAKQTITANASTVVGAPGNEIGAIVVVGNSSQVSLTDTTLGTNTVSITGTSTSLTASGDTTGTGSITLIGSVDAKVTTGTGPSVTVNGNSLGSIQGSTTTEKLESNFSVTVNSAGTVSGINLKNANVTINGGKVQTGAIQVTNGSVKLQNGATVGPVTFGENGIINEFSVTGSRNTVGTVSVTNSNTFKLVNIAADSTNTFTGTTAFSLGDYAGHGVHGGKFQTPIATAKEKAYLDSGLAYRVKLATAGGGTQYYQYFSGTAEGLSQAIAAAGSTNAVADDGILLVGQTKSKQITFQNGTTVLAKIGFSAPSSIVAPSVINGVTYTNWTLTSASDQAGTTITGGQEFTRTVLENITLDGQGVTGEVAKITNVALATGATGENSNVTVRMVGNTVTLSGAAVPAAGDLAVIEVKLTTDIVDSTGAPVAVEVGVSWNSKTGKTTFANDVALGYGITVSTDGSTLTLKNGVSYTVNGSGLKKLVNTFTTYEDGTEIKVTSVTAPGYTTNNQKNALIDTLLSTTASDSTFTWNANPEMLQAVNAAKATISENQVTNWRTQAQRTVWNKGSSKTPTDAELANTGYTKVMLIPYLNVTITKANPLTVTMTPYYRVEVWHTADTDGTSADNPPVEVQAGRALTGLNSMISSATDKELKVKFAGVTAATKAHQDGTYVYDVATGEFTVTHAGKTGLGTVEFNSTPAVVTLTRVKDAVEADGTVVTATTGNKYYYDSLQAAVDDTLPQASGKEDEIEITNAYSGNGSISVTGQARTIKITTNGNTTISSNASADVRVTAPATGSTYTIQLLKDAATATSRVSITVNAATGGTGSASATSVRPGDTVTYTPSPSAGYRLSSVSAKTNTGASVSMTANANGTYSFVVPAGATSVTVTPSFVRTSTTLPFNDVPTTAWYYNGVEYCYNTIRGSARLMQGMSATTFGPNTGFTRAQVVQILWNIKGQPEPTTTYNPYTDISSIHYAYKAMLWATQNGYAEGYVDNGVRTFRPNQGVTRQEMAVFLWRAAGKPTNYNSLNLNAYTDGYMVYDWAQPAMRWAIARGVLSGQSSVALGNYLSPRSVACRSEVAVTVMNFDKLAVFR